MTSTAQNATPTVAVPGAPTGRPAQPSPWDAWVVGGLTIVAATAIVASFTTLADLAKVAGWGDNARWLLPCCIDALAMAAARVWLSGKAPEPARRYARVVAMAAVTASVIGNSVGHLAKAGHLATTGNTGALLVILVGSVPAIALAAVAHLATLAGTPVPVKSRRTTRKTTPTTTTTGTGETGTVETGTVERDATRDKSDKSRPASDTGTGTRSEGGTGTGPGIGNGVKKKRSESEGKARAYWDAERAEGRSPTGADLARIAGVHDSYGRRWRRDWEKETPTPNPTAPEARPATETDSATATDSGTATRTESGRAA